MTLGYAGNVGIWTANPQSLLAVNGTLTAKQITVTNTGWSDYVFSEGYPLLPLKGVEVYIRRHKHLPEMPSETDVVKNGVNVGDIEAKLLAKIEELTLQMIQQEKRIDKLERENADLRSKVTSLGPKTESDRRYESMRRSKADARGGN